MKKKAVMHISIESFVILILAMVFLGLALFFMSYIFKESGTSVMDIFDYSTKQRIENLKASEKMFDIESYVSNIKPGEKRIMFMLLRNKDKENSYLFSIDHSVSNISNDINCGNVSLSYKKDIEVQPFQELTPPLVIKAEKNINKGTCFFYIKAAGSDGSIETLSLTINII